MIICCTVYHECPLGGISLDLQRCGTSKEKVPVLKKRYLTQLRPRPSFHMFTKKNCATQDKLFLIKKNDVV